MHIQIAKFVLILVPSCSLFFTHAYIIERKARYINGKWVYKPDRFIIPSSVCSNGSSSQSRQCNEMGGSRARAGGCTCVCNKKANGNFYKSTFFKKTNGNWVCFENSRLHEYEGCTDFLDGIESTRPLRVLPMATPMASYSLPTIGSSCSFAGYKYLKCDGTWEVMTTNLIMVTLPDDSSYHFLKYSADQSSIPAIGGRIVKVNFDCNDGWNQWNQCALFKVKGTTTCYLSPTSSSSMMFSTQRVQISTITVTLSSSSAPPPPPSSSLSPSPTSTRRLRPSVPLRTPSLSSNKFEYSSKTSTILGLAHTSAATVTETPTTETSTAIIKHREKSQSDDDNSGMIVGALAGVIGLVIIVIAIIIVVIRRRKKRDTDSKSTAIAENDGYGRGVDNSLRFNDRSQQSPDEDEYSYAYSNAVPFVKPTKQDLECHTNDGKEPGCSVANHIYDQTEELNQKASAPSSEAPVYSTLEGAIYAKVDKSRKEYPSNSDGPIYNTVEEPEYAKVDKSQKTKLSAENHDEPLYNVLEGPETDNSALGGTIDEPPCYQVLEGPFSEGAQVYDVLEGPESDEAPVYGAIEGQDPHVYGTLNMTDFQGSPDHEENRGYDDMVYDSVGDVINDHGDIYQELNQSGQRNSDVYQALNYPDKTIYCLNELNQTHSNA